MLLFSHHQLTFMPVTPRGLSYLMLVVLLSACRSSQPPPIAYAEIWPTQSRRYIGPDYWANDLGDWRVENGQLLCVSAAPERSLHLLTQSVADDSGDLYLSTQVQLLQPQLRAGYFGFQVGTRAAVDDYRATATIGQGIICGLTAQGELFIGDTAQADAISPLDMRIAWELRLRAQPQDGQRYRLSLTAHELNTGRRLEEISRDSLALDDLQGGLALVSSFQETKAPQQAVLRFDHWQVGGTLLRAHPERAYGPILFTRHSLDQQTLTLAAYLAPVNSQVSRLIRLEIDRGQGFQLEKESTLDPMSRVARFQLSRWQPEGPTPYRLSCQLNTDTGLTRYALVDTLLPPPAPAAQQRLAALGLPQTPGYPYPRLMALLTDQSPHWHLGVAPEPPADLPNSLTDADHPALLRHLQQWQELGWMMAPLWQKRPSLLTLPFSSTPPPISRTLQGAVHPLDAQGHPQPFAAWTYGGLSLALLDDAALPGTPANPLGESQQAFFTAWTRDWPARVSLKLAFSARNWQTSSLPESASRGAEPLDLGWPRVIQTLRQGLALHVVAPQGAAGLQPYRLQPSDDANVAFLSPGLPTTGTPGAAWGLIRIDPQAHTYTLSAFALPDSLSVEPEPLPDWPLVLHQRDQVGRAPVAWLPPLSVSTEHLPVVQVVQQATQQVVYTRRLSQRQIILPVYAPGRYRLRIWDPVGGHQQILSGIEAETQQGLGQTLRVEWR